MWRLIKAAVRDRTSSRSREALTESPISARVANTSAESSGPPNAATTPVCASVGFMKSTIIAGAPGASADTKHTSIGTWLFGLGWFGRIRAQFQNANVGNIAVALGVVQSVANDEFVGNGKANVVSAHGGQAAS